MQIAVFIAIMLSYRALPVSPYMVGAWETDHLPFLVHQVSKSRATFGFYVDPEILDFEHCAMIDKTRGVFRGDECILQVEGV